MKLATVCGLVNSPLDVWGVVFCTTARQGIGNKIAAGAV